MYPKALVTSLLLAAACGETALAQIEIGLVPRGSVWKYLDNGIDQGTGWAEFGYDDSTWAAGAAPLGYGDPWIATPVSFGPNSASKYVTTYFRTTFDIADPSTLSNLRIRVQRDDGMIVYLNEGEI